MATFGKHLQSLWHHALIFAILVCATGVTKTSTAQDEKSSPAAVRTYQGAANAQNTGSYRFASGEWEKLLKEHPNDPLAVRATYYLGICRLQLKDMNGAEESFSTLVEKHPDFPMLEESLLNLGWCQYTLGQEPIAEDATDAQAKVDLAARKGKLKAAAATFAKLLAAYPKGKRAHEAYYFRGESLYAIGETESAIEAYSTLIELFPQSNFVADSLYFIGVARQEAGELDEALSIYDRFVAGHQEHNLVTEVRLRKGEVLLAQNKAAEAEKFFAEASNVEDFKLADYALFRLAFSISEQRQFPRAAAVYESISTRFPKSSYVPQASMSVGRCWFRAGQWEKAEAALAKHGADREDPFYVEASHWLARILLVQDKPQDALALTTAAIEASGEQLVNYLDHVMLDRADALYLIEGKQQEALIRYVELADKMPKSPQSPQSLYNATFLALELGDVEQVDQLAGRFAEQYGDDGLAADVAVVQAESYSQRQKYAEAEEAFSAIIAKYGDHPGVSAWRLRLAFTLYLQSKYDETVKLLSACIETLHGDQSAEGHYLIGMCHFNAKEYAVAAKDFAAAVAAGPQWLRRHEAQLQIARCQFELKELKSAVELLREFLTTSPAPRLASQAHHWLGEALYADGQFRDAAVSYEQVGVLDPASNYLPFSQYGEAWSYLKGTQTAEAIAAFGRIIDLGEEHKRYNDAFLGRGIARRQSGDLPAALADMDVFLKRTPEGPQRADAQYERALVLVSLKQWKEVVASLSDLIAKHPNDSNIDKSVYELAWAHRNLDDKANASKWFTELAEKHTASPLAAEAHFHLAEARYDAKEYRKAMELYQKAQSNLADRAEISEKAAYKNGWCWFQLQEYEKALQLFESQVKRFAEGGLRPDGLFMQAECYFKLNDYEKSLPIYLDVMQLPLSSDNVEGLALLHGGQAASKLKKWDDCVTLLSEIFARQPKSPYAPEAHLERGWARQNLDQVEDAFNDFAITAETAGELGARARFMMGEARFQQKAYSDAIGEFQRVMFYYGGDKAPDSVRKWQARAAMEAGRCAELLVAAAKNNREKKQNIDEAKKFYEYILNNHPGADYSKTARGRLEQLRRL
jgi:TolA-binding protein